MGNVPNFDLGIICGRFGHVHRGHNSLFDLGLQLCRRTYIIVGSAQERGTLRNPFSVETRIKTIRECYPSVSEKQLIIGSLNDLSNELDVNSDWGKYLKNHVVNKMHKFANVMIYGNDERRSSWFAPEDLVGTYEFIAARETIPISATMVRGMLVIDDEAGWQKCTLDMIHYLYSELREELMSTPIYKQIYDEVRQNKVMDLDAFMKVYSVYEEADKAAKLAQLQKK